MTKKKNNPPKKKRYGLSPWTTRRNAREFVDFNYLDKLSEEELDWLDKFSREYYQASFKNTDEDKHGTQEQRRDVYRNNNYRNNDIWNKGDRSPEDYTDISIKAPEGED